MHCTGIKFTNPSPKDIADGVKVRQQYLCSKTAEFIYEGSSLCGDCLRNLIGSGL